MSISGVSSSNNVYQNQVQQIRKDFTTLESDLSSGGLTQAKTDYATLMQDLQNGTQSSAQTSGSSSLYTDLTAVGTALQNSDLTGAQSAFSTLTQDLQSAEQTQGSQQAHGHHHHHHHSESTEDATSTSSSTTPTLTSDFLAIGTALQSGDLTGAQNAYTTFIQALQNGITQSTGTTTQTTGSLLNLNA